MSTKELSLFGRRFEAVLAQVIGEAISLGLEQMHGKVNF